MSEKAYTKGKTVQPLDAVNIPTARLRMETIVALTGMSRSTIYRWIAEGKFPKPLNGDEGRSLWLAAPVKEWLQAGATQPA
jgi:prophage regulatory protein